jgi:predicted nucleic acid-binding protein
MLLELCEFIEIAGIEKKEVINALTNEVFDDLEDCLQVECARMVNADYVVTRDISDFSASPIPAILPEELLKKMAVQKS